jgi:hypothetical protein
MHKNAMKCNKTLSKWCKNKHGASKIIDTFETYQEATWGDSGIISVTTQDFVKFLGEFFLLLFCLR